MEDEVRVVRLDAELRRITGLGKSARKQLLRAGRFPQPLFLSPRARGWSLASLKKWIADRETEGPHAAQLDREAIEKVRAEQLYTRKVRRIAGEERNATPFPVQKRKKSAP